MALLATPSLAGANYMTSSNDEKESLSNGAAEFTRRKKWPEILLKELVGGTIFCLKPISVRKTSQASTSSSSTNNDNNKWGWKIVYTSPASADMLGQKPTDLDGKDFFDLVFASDHPHLYTFFNSLLTPSLAHHSSSATTSTTSSSFAQGSGSGSGQGGQSRLSPSQTTHVRMLSFSGDSPSSSSDTPTSSIRRSGSTGPTVWELRAHASGLGEEVNPDLASGGMGTVIPGGTEKGKAIWVMGRKVAENNGDSEGSGSSNGGGGNGQSLEAFLELKLENERLREELRELQQDLDEDYVPSRSTFSDLSPTKPHHHTSIHQQQYGYDPSSPSSSSSSQSSSASSPTRHNQPSTSIASASASASNVNKPTPKTKTAGRPPKDKTLEGGGGGTEKERKRAKRMSLAAQGEKEGMHVCVTCGRTDSPEWRKGPLGPKTLCNACGLRWAKRNSTQPGRKERKTEVKK